MMKIYLCKVQLFLQDTFPEVVRRCVYFLGILRYFAKQSLENLSNLNFHQGVYERAQILANTKLQLFLFSSLPICQVKKFNLCLSLLSSEIEHIPVHSLTVNNLIQLIYLCFLIIFWWHGKFLFCMIYFIKGI